LKDPDFTIAFHRGELFKGTEHAKEAATLKAQERAPIVLDANVDAVQHVLEESETNA
jgi:hypothetical protein